MDIFLNFKNKNLEAQFFESVDPYLSKVMKASSIIVLVVVPFFPYTEYVIFQDSTTPIDSCIRRLILAIFVLVILAIAVLLIYKKKDMLRRHQKATRMSFDIFFTLVAGYYAYQFYDSSNEGTDTITEYILGWWQCLYAVTLFSPISRWYLKLAAFVAIFLRLGLGAYSTTQSSLVLIKMIQMVLIIVLLTYYHEKDRRRYFIEKQSLYEETKVFKEIFDLTSDGVIIYGLRDGMLFRNWTNEKYRWWQGDNCQQNFERILLKGYRQLAQLPSTMDLDLGSLFQSPNQINFGDLLQHLTQQLSINLAKSQNSPRTSLNRNSMSQSLKTGNLVFLTGSVEQRCPSSTSPNDLIANSTSQLEIKIVFTFFREKPSLVLVFSDTTEHNLVSALQETNDYKSRLLASVSHELRTPLNASINFTQEAIEHPDLSTLPDIRENYRIYSLLRIAGLQSRLPTIVGYE